MKGLPFLSKMVYKRVRVWGELKKSESEWFNVAYKNFQRIKRVRRKLLQDNIIPTSTGTFLEREVSVSFRKYPSFYRELL